MYKKKVLVPIRAEVWFVYAPIGVKPVVLRLVWWPRSDPLACENCMNEVKLYWQSRMDQWARQVRYIQRFFLEDQHSEWSLLDPRCPPTCVRNVLVDKTTAGRFTVFSFLKDKTSFPTFKSLSRDIREISSDFDQPSYRGCRRRLLKETGPKGTFTEINEVNGIWGCVQWFSRRGLDQECSLYAPEPPITSLRIFPE